GIPDERGAFVLIHRASRLVSPSPEQYLSVRQHVRMDRYVRQLEDWIPLSHLCRSGRPPDAPPTVKPIELITCRGDLLSSGISVQQLPSGDRRSGIPPDTPALVKLIKIIVHRGDLLGGGISVQQLPPGDRRSGIPPDTTIIMKLIKIIARR